MSIEYEDIQAHEESTSGLQVFQQDLAIIDIQIATARKYPRDEERAKREIKKIITASPQVSETMMYTLKKGKVISGPSVNLARIIAQRYCNFRAETKIVDYTNTHVIAAATAFDLETNYALRSEIRRSIIDKDQIRFSADLITITGNAASAIAFRNVVFGVVKKEFVDEMYAAALEGITGNLSDETKLSNRRTKVFEGFKKSYPHLNLTDEIIAKSVSRNSIDHVTAKDIAILVGFENAIKAGEADPANVFMQYTPKPVIPIDKSEQRIALLISNAQTRADLEKLKSHLKTTEARNAFDEAWAKLK